MSLNNYRVIRFYTNEAQPLPTNQLIMHKVLVNWV